MIRTQQEYQTAKRNLDKLHQLRSEMLVVTSLDGDARTNNIDAAITDQEKKIREYESNK
ncbi:hypothetical protein [Vibrio mediterranei]|jgi:hypothetical protein|uniref:hypothetical protein n=1 Tax=Vibrio mediterranei TaxID=689 RepID=UPI002284EB32|nr:hypothetical protein [Vibrio mediterranei]MCY9855995.1 hypothetical protein [Vibrio mediterranei]